MTRSLSEYEDRYECSGKLKLADKPTGDWTLDVQLAPVDAAENQQETLKPETLEVVAGGETLESSGGSITISEEHEEINYRQVSSINSEAGKGGKMRVTVDIDANLEGDS
jgi:hypothetical protein